MPVYEELASPRTTIVVAPSAALELFWITFRCCEEPGAERNNPHPLFETSNRRNMELTRRIQEFWDDAYDGFPELIVIAQRRGMLLGDSLDEFLTGLPVGALRTGDLTLASETPATRALIIKRLDRLARDGALRRRYLGLLRELWRAVRSEWETVGLAAVGRACDLARQRLAGGEQPADLAHKVSETSLALLRQGGHDAVAICPGYFTGRCVWELQGTLVLGIPAGGGDQLAALRAAAGRVAPRLKALSDPTRLAVMLRLARGPASITDITREFGISQPAVSVHFRVLRDAELVAGVRSGSRTLYSVDFRRANDLFEELSRSFARPATAG